mmetsp:Transcript_39265/g.78125  ORF Transcript_39265/g.78125 Transcript_39265/m.78125 type:complete len:229 (-) Transcript_39265:653-1339(-)
MHQRLKPDGHGNAAENFINHLLKSLLIAEKCSATELVEQRPDEAVLHLLSLSPECRSRHRVVGLVQQDACRHTGGNRVDHVFIRLQQHNCCFAEIRRYLLDLQNIGSNPLKRGDQGALVQRPLSSKQSACFDGFLTGELGLGADAPAYFGLAAGIGEIHLPKSFRRLPRHLHCCSALDGFLRYALGPSLRLWSAELGGQAPFLFFEAVNYKCAVLMFVIRPTFMQTSL